MKDAKGHGSNRRGTHSAKKHSTHSTKKRKHATAAAKIARLVSPRIDSGLGTHSSGINSIGNVSLHPSVLPTVMANPGGFSVKPSTGQMPTSGFMVSIPGHTKIISEADLHGQHGEHVIEQYAKEHADVLQQPGAHIGGWTDAASGKVYLDVSHNLKNKNEAVRAGKKYNQIAIWDVKNSREIHTGGTGT